MELWGRKEDHETTHAQAGKTYIKMISAFSELIEEYEFFIPDYQRAYSWTEEQVSLFIADIAEHAGNADKKTQYYLGHYILEDDKNGKYAIVDGQQRLTTVAIFLAVCQSLKNSPASLLPLRLSVVEYDNNRFQELLLPSNLTDLMNAEGRHNEATASLERVVKAIQTFNESFVTQKKQHEPALLSVAKIDAYIDVIRKAAVSVGIYPDKAVAAQIFELHNTRGVLLTETEKVKALLMRYVYLNSTDGNRDVDEIQKSFAEVFELEETAADASFRGEMSLDDILRHHLCAIDDGKDKALFTQPQSVEGENGCLACVRTKLNDFDSNRVAGIQYAKALASEFAKSMSLVSKTFVEQDKKEPLVGDVILLDQRRSMIFLLRYFRTLPIDQIADHGLLKRWESFLFLWDCHDAFYNMKSGKKDSFPDIFIRITEDRMRVAELLGEYYSGKKAFAYRNFQIGLARIFREYITKLEEHLLHRAHNWGHWHGRYKYWLYKHEIEYESKHSASDKVNQVRSSLRKLFKENAVTLDHIVPRGLEWNELSVKGEPDNNIEDWKDPDDREKAIANWKGISETIDGIGNLVLLSRSDNASLQNIAPFKRTAEYEARNLESVSYLEVAEWKTPIEWRAKIEARGKCLLKWMQDYFTDEATWADKDTK